jgi:hypothetical protein
MVEKVESTVGSLVVEKGPSKVATLAAWRA